MEKFLGGWFLDYSDAFLYGELDEGGRESLLGSDFAVEVASKQDREVFGWLILRWDGQRIIFFEILVVGGADFGDGDNKSDSRDNSSGRGENKRGVSGVWWGDIEGIWLKFEDKSEVFIWFERTSSGKSDGVLICGGDTVGFVGRARLADETLSLAGEMGSDVIVEMDGGGEMIESLRPAGAVGVPIELLIGVEIGDDAFETVV